MFEKLRRDWHLRDTEKRIAKHGWTAIYVGDYASVPTWAYSVGFEDSLGQPEAVVFDAPMADANSFFHEAHEGLKAGAFAFADGAPWGDDNPPRAIWREVHPSQLDGPDGWFNVALARRVRQGKGERGWRAFQLVLADAAGKLPWEPGYDEAIRARQPALWLPALGPQWTNALEREALRLVGERGWTTVPVEGPDLEWAYTIGLPASVGAPELIGFGPAHGMARMLSDARQHIADGKLALSDGLGWSGLGFDTCWRRVHESQVMGFQWMRLAKAHAEELAGQRVSVDAFQLFLADAAGHFPWESKCDARFRKMQPLLFEPLDPSRLPRSVLAGGGGM